MALNYGPGWGCYMADTNKTPPRERKRVPPRIMTTANTNTSHTALGAKWRWNIYIEAVPSHHCRKKAELESLLLHWPHTVHEKNCTKNSSYCWLGSGIKSAALCCGLVRLDCADGWGEQAMRVTLQCTLPWGHVNMLQWKCMCIYFYIYFMY